MLTVRPKRRASLSARPPPASASAAASGLAPARQHRLHDNQGYTIRSSLLTAPAVKRMELMARLIGSASRFRKPHDNPIPAPPLPADPLFSTQPAAPAPASRGRILHARPALFTTIHSNHSPAAPLSAGPQCRARSPPPRTAPAASPAGPSWEAAAVRAGTPAGWYQGRHRDHAYAYAYIMPTSCLCIQRDVRCSIECSTFQASGSRAGTSDVFLSSHKAGLAHEGAR
jgi:hypothetical protein